MISVRDFVFGVVFFFFGRFFERFKDFMMFI